MSAEERQPSITHVDQGRGRSGLETLLARRNGKIWGETCRVAVAHGSEASAFHHSLPFAVGKTVRRNRPVGSR